MKPERCKLILKRWGLQAGLLLCSLGPLLGCSSASEEAAFLMNRIATYEPLGSWDGSFEEELFCGGRKYVFGEGTVARLSNVSGDDVDIRVESKIDVLGPDVFGIGFANEGEDPSFNCQANLKYKFDADSGKAKGKGEVVDCSDFKCEVNGIKVSCAELKAALPKFGCD